MRTLKKRIDNMNFYLNSKGTTLGESMTIRSAQNPMSPRMTQTMDKTRSKRTTDKIKTNMEINPVQRPR